jgi:hypothetical protein
LFRWRKKPGGVSQQVSVCRKARGSRTVLRLEPVHSQRRARGREDAPALLTAAHEPCVWLVSATGWGVRVPWVGQMICDDALDADQCLPQDWKLKYLG